MQALQIAVFCLAAAPVMALAQSSAGAGGGVDLLNFAMKDAQLLAGGNVAAAENSTFGQFVLSHMQSGNTGLQTFISETGIDPRTDVSELLLASTGAPGPEAKWLLAAHGSFGVSMGTIEGAAQKNGGTVTHLAGVDVVTLGGPAAANTPAPNVCAAFFTAALNTALAGDCGSVNAAAQSGGSAPSISPSLAAKVAQLRAVDDLWFTSVVPLAQFANGLPNGPLSGVVNTNLFQGIQQTSGGVKFAAANAQQGPALQLSGEVLMDSAQDATSLLNVVKFLAGMVQMSNTSDPAVTAIAGLLTNLQATANGAAVDLSLTLPETTLEQLILSQQSQTPRPAAERRGAKRRAGEVF